jgi:hypothetical protein
MRVWANGRAVGTNDSREWTQSFLRLVSDQNPEDAMPQATLDNTVAITAMPWPCRNSSVRHGRPPTVMR